MKVLYRISDSGNSKHKLHFVNDKCKMFLHFINIFKNYDIYVFADNVSDETYNFLKENFDNNKIKRISLGNAHSFIYSLNFAIFNFATVRLTRLYWFAIKRFKLLVFR